LIFICHVENLFKKSERKIRCFKRLVEINHPDFQETK
jgi:hypothetical protein